MFSNSLGFKSVFAKLRFRDREVWTEGLTGEIKLHLHIPWRKKKYQSYRCKKSSESENFIPSSNCLIWIKNDPIHSLTRASRKIFH